MKRKNFIQQINLTTCGIILNPLSFSFEFSENRKKWQRVVCSNIDFPKALFPSEKRIPLGWKTFPVLANGNESTLHFPNIKAYLRLELHLLIDEKSKPEKDFRKNLLSMNSISPFGMGLLAQLQAQINA